MVKIVISYRRSDTRWAAGRIFDRLENLYGPGSIFLDFNAIPVGTAFPERLQSAVARCDVLLVLIGPNWLDGDGKRLRDKSDWVRAEIRTAFERRVPVLPILIDGTKMPDASDLPSDLRTLASLQAASIDGDADFRIQMANLEQMVNAQYLVPWKRIWQLGKRKYRRAYEWLVFLSFIAFFVVLYKLS